MSPLDFCYDKIALTIKLQPVFCQPPLPDYILPSLLYPITPSFILLIHLTLSPAPLSVLCITQPATMTIPIAALYSSMSPILQIPTFTAPALSFLHPQPFPSKGTTLPLKPQWTPLHHLLLQTTLSKPHSPFPIPATANLSSEGHVCPHYSPSKSPLIQA